MAQAPAVGSSIGPYRIVTRLGAGGMGVVYAARDDEQDLDVALKVVLPHLAEDKRFVDRFLREAKTAQAVQHENVVLCFGGGTHGPNLYIAFELVAGGTLKDKLAGGPLPWREAATIGAQIARGLEAVHGVGIVHRDLKPANVLLDTTGVAKIADFGLARGEGILAITKTGEFLGTPDYMAPEMAESAKGVGPAADLYMLGGTLHALLTGKAPFEGLSTIEIVTAHMTRPPSGVRSFDPTIPTELEQVVLRLLAKNPADRGAGAGAVAAELEKIARTSGDGRRSRRGPAVLAAAILALAAAGAFAFAPRPAPPPPPPPPPPVPVGPKAAPRDPRAWYHGRPREKRAALPKGLVPSDVPDQYVWEKDGSILVHVPAGRFAMGATRERDPLAYDGEAPIHTVTLSAYFIGKHPVTNDQFARFVEEAKHTTTAENVNARALLSSRGSAFLGRPLLEPTLATFEPRQLTWRRPHPESEETPPADFGRRPVVQVSWIDAQAYAKWAGLVLPTEAQWERAAAWDARTQRSLNHPWGDELEPFIRGGRPLANLRDRSFAAEARHARQAVAGLAAYDHDDGFGLRPAPVGSFAGASPVGAEDMTGNVRQCVRDASETGSEYADVLLQRGPDPCYTTGTYHAMRGSSWADGSRDARTHVRWRSDMDQAPNELTGFRVALGP